MTGTLCEKPNRPNYYIVISYKDAQTGRWKKKWIATDIPIKGNNKREANLKLQETLTEYRQQRLTMGKEIFFTDFLREWLENTRSTITAVTYNTYKLVIYNQILPYFEPKKLKIKDVTPMHIQQYINYKLKSVSPNTVRKHLFNISKAMDSALKQNLIPFNPVKRIEMPKKIKFTGAKFYDEKQIAALLEAAKGDPLDHIIHFALFYGLRRSEVMGLKWDAVDFENKTISIKHTVVQHGTKLHKNNNTKNISSFRTLPLAEKMKEILLDIKKQQEKYKQLQPNDYIEENYIFTYPNGKLISPNYVTRHFKLLLEKNGLPIIRFHDLRHSSASYLLNLGFNLKQIQYWLGHGDISTTMNIYAHLDISSKREIADILNHNFENIQK